MGYVQLKKLGLIGERVLDSKESSVFMHEGRGSRKSQLGTPDLVLGGYI